MKAHAVLYTAAVTAAAFGCGEDSMTEAEPCTADTAAVDVTVTTGSSVRFDWNPACEIMLLLVEEDGSDRWSISAPDMDANTIVPPITYGVVPSGAVEGDPPATLQAGVTYDVVLWRLHPTQPNTEILLAVEPFTP